MFPVEFIWFLIVKLISQAIHVNTTLLEVPVTNRGCLNLAILKVHP